MKLLAISDIHGNVAAVEELRSREKNVFDAVLVAGDIGGDNAQGVLTVLTSFGCPVLYIYGNWDHDLTYDHSFGDSCHHVHLRPVECGGRSIVGLSGLPTHWGRNPIAERVESLVREKHREILSIHDKLELDVESAEFQIESIHETRMAELNSRTKDRRRRSYRAAVKKLEQARDDQTRLAALPLTKLQESEPFMAFERDFAQGLAEIATLNRKALVEAIMASNGGPNRAIVVTHERLYKTWADMPGVPLFLFGHRHGFQKTTFRGATFVNVSALDIQATVKPVGSTVDVEDYRNVNKGNYVVVEIRAAHTFDIRCVSFEPRIKGWKEVDFVLVGAPLFR